MRRTDPNGQARRTTPGRRLAPAAVAPLLALTLAACGSSSKPTTTATSPTSLASATTLSHTASASSTTTSAANLVLSTPGAKSAATTSAATSSSASTTISGTTYESSDPTTLIAVDSVCETYDTKSAKIKAPPFSPTSVTKAQLPVAAAYLAKVVPLMQGTSAALKAAAKTSKTPKPFKLVAGIFATMTADENALQRDARQHDLAGFQAGVTKVRGEAVALDEETGKLDLSDC